MIKQSSQTLLTALLFIAVAWGCADSEAPVQPQETKDPLAIAREEGSVRVNGVERTELALLMRKMHDDLEKVKDSLRQGYAVKSNYAEAYKRIKEAHPTEPEKIDAAYQSMADAFIQQYQQFEEHEGDQVAAFNLMLDNCLSCHQHKCPGPIKAIKKLKISVQP